MKNMSECVKCGSDACRGVNLSAICSDCLSEHNILYKKDGVWHFKVSELHELTVSERTALAKQLLFGE